MFSGVMLYLVCVRVCTHTHVALVAIALFIPHINLSEWTVGVVLRIACTVVNYFVSRITGL